MSEARLRSQLRIPRLFWLMLITALVIGGSLALHLGLPPLRQLAALEEIERVGGHFETNQELPDWRQALAEWAGNDDFATKGLGKVEYIQLSMVERPDPRLVH